LNVDNRNFGGSRLKLEGQDVVERAVRPFDLRAQQSLSANVHSLEQADVGQLACGAVQTTNCLIGCG
jgi:hypothetical protein